VRTKPPRVDAPDVPLGPSRKRRIGGMVRGTIVAGFGVPPSPCRPARRREPLGAFLGRSRGHELGARQKPASRGHVADLGATCGSGARAPSLSRHRRRSAALRRYHPCLKPCEAVASHSPKRPAPARRTGGQRASRLERDASRQRSSGSGTSRR
jgi:hypothetical protein